jgi:hypothetical protein
MIMELYCKYQPVTWYVGVVEACPKDVVASIHPKYIPNEELDGIYQEKKTIDEGFAAMEPIGSPTKFLLAQAVDGRTILFRNSAADMLELPTWSVAGDLNVSAHYICSVPNTISKDQYSGKWGARKIEFRTVQTPFNKEPAFGIQVINDCGRWHFYRYGEKQPFEEEKAYKAWRKPERFTEAMLVHYCDALGIPVYNRNFYADEWILIKAKPDKYAHMGYSYEEAKVKFHLDRNR